MVKMTLSASALIFFKGQFRIAFFLRVKDAKRVSYFIFLSFKILNPPLPYLFKVN